MKTRLENELRYSLVPALFLTAILLLSGNSFAASNDPGCVYNCNDEQLIHELLSSGSYNSNLLPDVHPNDPVGGTYINSSGDSVFVNCIARDANGACTDNRINVIHDGKAHVLGRFNRENYSPGLEKDKEEIRKENLTEISNLNVMFFPFAITFVAIQRLKNDRDILVLPLTLVGDIVKYPLAPLYFVGQGIHLLIENEMQIHRMKFLLDPEKKGETSHIRRIGKVLYPMIQNQTLLQERK